ncbi:hypothetical protein BN1723_018531, partial [Verticillium longisporum]
AHC